MGSLLVSFKVGVFSFTILCAAMVLKLSLPTLTEFAYSELPSLWTVLMTWLKPPYLYVVINGIIITLVASSKLHHHKQTVDLSPVIAVDEFPAVEAARPETFFDASNIMKVPGYDVYHDAVLLPEEETKVMTSVMDYSVAEKDKVMITTATFDGNGVDNVVISKTPERISEELFVLRSEKPPVSVRTGRRKSVKSTEGGKALRVSKPKRQETLETTWKTITEGRSMPLTRHHRKSDTWDSHDHHLPQDPKMTKSETFNVPSDRHDSTTATPASLGRLRKEPSGSWKLKKDPSLSQDDLNRRVEAFINKFNEDMRLQRQESLQQYMQMINRGAH